MLLFLTCHYFSRATQVIIFLCLYASSEDFVIQIMLSISIHIFEYTRPCGIYHHYFLHIIISATSSSPCSISRVLLFLAYYYFSYFIISDTLLFSAKCFRLMLIQYFMCILLFIIRR